MLASPWKSGASVSRKPQRLLQQLIALAERSFYDL
jgi:hypothetical protein